ncbi:WXG100 family type VII secretion target [Streptomyces sp. NPDC052687]|uniref:WXG100 family type VII secretion target n=1 Tax=Streptomyces sp. NPDC052687 TaxID=3154759 RepID=UPI0034447310
MSQPRLRAERDKLTALADDLDDMQDFLDQQVRRMNAIVDGIEAKWQGSTASAYRALHRGAAEDAVRIREVLKLIEQAVRLSRDGFTEKELETLWRLRQIQVSVDVEAEANELSTPNTQVPPQPPRSRLDDL